MGQQEPPPSISALFFVGKDRQGHWVVQDQQHRCGGLFIDRKEALRFALFENGHRPQAVVMVPGVFELDLTGETIVGHQPQQAGIIGEKGVAISARHLAPSAKAA